MRSDEVRYVRGWEDIGRKVGGEAGVRLGERFLNPISNFASAKFRSLCWLLLIMDCPFLLRLRSDEVG